MIIKPGLWTNDVMSVHLLGIRLLREMSSCTRLGDHWEREKGEQIREE